MCEVRSFETCNLTPVLPFPLKQNLSPKDIGRRDTEAERLIGTMGPKGLT